MELKQAFGKAIKKMRMSRNLTQEAFWGTCSQTYLSQLEGGGKGPTLEMVNALASTMDVHPLTLLMECYLIMDNDATSESIMRRIRDEIDKPPAS